MSLTENTPIEKISGTDFLPAYYYHHRNNVNIKIFLLGSRNGIAQKAMDRINEKVGRNIVVAAHSPSLGFDTKEEECREIIQHINRSEANVLIVGVGSSKGEQWIIKYRDSLPGIGLFMALGAAIDIEAGVVKRAPRWVSTMALEWAYRLYQEPKRLWRRYLIEDIVLFWLLLKQAIGIYRNPWN
jgi:N-acetylglucosaminyldiphosphoundecaprenol N-acetyl-beta-D-mannosaminyltransferase